MSTKKTPSVERRTVANPALEAFEKAVKALGKKDYERAQDLFGDILETYPEERDLLERVRAYRTVCARALADSKRGPFKPKTFEDMLQYGVFLHNRGEFEEALKYLRQAVELHPKNEHAQYCLAATAARAGDTPSALKALRSAIAAGPSNRAQARSDPDFDPIRDDDGFVEIVYSQAS
jgi:tetratricopeptide (TPR) repeat protein